MILGDIEKGSTFTMYNERITAALQWIKEHYKERFPKGVIELTDLHIKINCEEVAMVPQQMLEAHRRYIDIHVPQSDEETIGWSSLRDLKNCISSYDADKDIEFYGDAPQCLLQVRPGQFAIFFPEDAHAPNIGIGNHRELCVKIPVD